MSETCVRVGGLTFWGGAGNDGFYIKDAGLTGVLGGVGVRSSTVEIPEAHGEFDVPVFRSGRIVSIEGPCIAPSVGEWLHRNHELTGLLAGGERGRVVFDLPNGPLWADARLAEAPQWEPVLWGTRADYLLQLKFAKPQLFGAMNTAAAAASVTIFHYGNFKASPVLVITPTSSMTSGYTLNLPGGKKVIVTQPLTMGHVHEYNTATGRLKLDGVLQVGATSRRDTIAVKGGAQVAISVTASAGAGLITPFTPDTFI